MFINTSLPCTLADSPTSTPRISARLPSSIDSSSSPLLISSSSSSNSNTTLQELSFSESVQSSQTRPSISPDGLFSYPSLTRLSKSKNSTNHRKNSSTSGDGRGDDDHRQHPSHPHHVNTSQTKSRSELFTKLTSAHQLEELGSKCRKAVQAYTHLPTPQQDTVNELLKFAINKTTEFCSVVGGVGTESRAKAFLAGAFGNDLVPGYYSLVDNNNNNSSSGGGGNSNCDEENYITSTSQGGASSRLLTINGVEDSDDIHSILSRLSELDDSVISDIEEVEEEEEVGKVGEEEDDSDDIQRMLSRLSVFNDNAHIEDEDYKEEKGGEDVEMLKSNEDIMEKMVALGATVSAVSSSFSDNIFPSRSSSLSSASSNSPLDEGFASSSSKSPIPISSLSAAKEEQANSTNFKDATIQDIPVAAIEMQQEEGGNPRSGVLADRYFRQRSPERFTNSSRSSSRSSLALHTNTSSSSGTGSNGSASSSTTSSPGNRCTRQSRPPILNFESLSRHRVSRLQTSPEGASTILMNNDPTGIKRSDSTPPNHQLPMNDLASDSVSLASTSGGSRKCIFINLFSYNETECISAVLSRSISSSTTGSSCFK